MAHHKRRRPKQSRAGCLMCKPHKFGHGRENVLGKTGFGNLRGEYHQKRDMREFA